MAWAFSGPLVGAGIHPVGSWLSDKINSGSKVTQRTTIVSIAAVLGVAYFVVAARSAPQPEIYWWPFFGLFMILFITTGLGNGSVFRSVPYIFSPDKASPVSGWIAAIKYIPKIIKFLGYVPFETSTLSVGEQIILYRKLHGLSQKKLACQIDIDPCTLRKWERDKQKPSEIFLNKLKKIVTVE